VNATGENPLVSVIIPTFNRAGLLLQAVESVVGQEITGPRVEVIVIDDGSTDETRDALAPYLPRLCYAFQENAGLSAARNHGLRLAQGKHVLFLDSDDLLLPGALTELLECFTDRPELGAVQGGWRTVDVLGETLCDIEPWRRSPNLDLETWVMDTPLFLGGMLCRRSWAERVAGFDTGLSQAEDVDFVLKLALHGCRFAWLRRVVVGYRQHDGNLTRDGLDQSRSIERVYARLFAQPDLPQRLRDIQDEVYYYQNAHLAWRLYRTGADEEVTSYLQRSMDRSRVSRQQTVLQWSKMIFGWSRGVGTGIEDLEGILPHVRSAGGLNDGWWRSFEAALPWWAAIWSYYLTEEGAPPDAAWASEARRSTAEVLALAQISLLLTPVEATVWAVNRFWNDVRTLELEPPLREPDLVALYLTAFGQAVLARRPSIARRALSHALRHSRGLAALGAWRRFATNAMRYAVSRPDRAPAVGR